MSFSPFTTELQSGRAALCLLTKVGPRRSWTVSTSAGKLVAPSSQASSSCWLPRGAVPPALCPGAELERFGCFVRQIPSGTAAAGPADAQERGRGRARHKARRGAAGRRHPPGRTEPPPPAAALGRDPLAQASAGNGGAGRQRTGAGKGGAVLGRGHGGKST